MKRLVLLAALLVSTAAVGAAASESESPPAPESRADHSPRVAEGFFEGLWGEGRHAERHGHQKRHWGEDDDDDDGEAREGRGGGASGQADPNAANAPVPDNGVFSGKARPKVEVR